jgi:hypothetical protein
VFIRGGYPFEEDFIPFPFSPEGIPRIQPSVAPLQDLPVKCISRLAHEILNQGGRFFSMGIMELEFPECADEGTERPREQAARRAKLFRNSFSIGLIDLGDMTNEAISWYNRFRPDPDFTVTLHRGGDRIYPPPAGLRRVVESLLNTEDDSLV